MGFFDFLGGGDSGDAPSPSEATRDKRANKLPPGITVDPSTYNPPAPREGPMPQEDSSITLPDGSGGLDAPSLGSVGDAGSSRGMTKSKKIGVTQRSQNQLISPAVAEKLGIEGAAKYFGDLTGKEFFGPDRADPAGGFEVEKNARDLLGRMPAEGRQKFVLDEAAKLGHDPSDEPWFKLLSGEGFQPTPESTKPGVGGAGLKPGVVQAEGIEPQYAHISPDDAIAHIVGDREKVAELAARIKANSQEFGDFGDLDKADHISFGWRKYVEALGPEGMQKFVGDIMSTFGGGAGAMAGAALGSEGGANATGRVVDEAAMQAEANPQYQADIERRTLKQKFTELSNTGPMRTTGGVLLWVLASMFLGPKIATMLLSDRAKAGLLQADIMDLKSRISMHERRVYDSRRDEARARQQAALEDRRQKNAMDREAIRAAERQRELIFKLSNSGRSNDKAAVKLMDRYRDHMTRYDKLKGKADFYQGRMDQANADLYMKAADEELKKAFVIGDMVDDMVEIGK